MLVRRVAAAMAAAAITVGLAVTLLAFGIRVSRIHP